MAVVANISVLLSARIEGYRSQIGFARRDNESFARSAVAAGLKVRDAGKAMDILRQRSFELLSTQQKLNEELQAIGQLYRAGIIDQQNYAKAVNQVNQAYQQKAAAEAAKAQDSFNNAVQRGTQLLRPQIAAQKAAMVEYKQTVAALNALQQSGTASRLGITAEEIENRKREAFLVGQAKFQGRETPAQIQEQARIATEAATAAVAKFNDRFLTARQRLRETINELRTLREQAELAGKPLDIQAQQQFVRKAIEDYRRDSGLADRLRREQKAQEENNQAIQRGIQLMDKNFSARQRLGQQLRDLQAAAKADPDRFGGQKLEEARRAAFQAFRAETQQSTQLAAASVDKFNQRFVTARQRLRETINELRVLREQAAQAGRVLDRGAQAQFVRKAVEDFRRDSGLDAKLRDETKARDLVNQSIERGLQLADKEFATNQRRRQQLLQQLADINAAREAYKGLDVRKFAAASRGIFDELNAIREGRESPAAIAERQAAELAANKARIEKENIAAIKATQTAEQVRAQEYARINQDVVNGLSAEAAARRRLAVDAEFNRRTGVDQRQQIETDLVNRYNEAIQRGIQFARPAQAATDQYRQSLKDIGKALNAARISQQDYNLARLQAQRIRQDTSLSPILQSGINQVAPYRQVVQNVIRTIEDMRAAVQAGKVTQAEYNRTLQLGNPPIIQLANALSLLRGRLKSGEISQREFAAGARQAKLEIMGQQSALDRFMKTFGVFRTVFIGLASAQVFGGIFQGINDGFSFEPQIRRSIALFGELEESTKAALRQTVVSSTRNNVPLIERAKVLEELAKDGVKAEVAMRVFSKTLDFSSVSGLGAQDAVSRVSEVMNAYRLATGDANEDTIRLYQTMDLLQFSSTQTASNVLQLAEALIRTAPQANLLGISIREAAQGAIALSEIGRKGEVGGNELAIALRDLTIKAVQNKEAWEKLGLTVFENDGTYAGMSVTIRQLSNLLNGLSAEQQTMTLLTLGVTQKASQFQQQLVSLIDRLDDAKTSFEDTNGAVDRIQKESLTELVVMINKTRTAFSAIINSTIVSWLGEVAGWINRNGIEFQQWASITIAAIVGVVTATNAFRVALTLTSQAYVIFQALSGPKGWFQLGIGIAAAGVSLAATTALFDELNKTMEATQLPEIISNIDALGRSVKNVENDLYSLVRSGLRKQLEAVFDAFYDPNVNPSIQFRLFSEIVDDDLKNVEELLAKATIEDLRNVTPIIEEIFGDPNLWRPGSDFLRSFDRATQAEMEAYFISLREQLKDASFALRELNDEDLKEALKNYQRLAENLRTPIERAIDELGEIEKFKEIGVRVSPLIEARQIARTIETLDKEFQDRANTDIRVNAAAELRGSAAAFSSSVAVKLRETEQQERKNQHIETIRQMQSQNSSLRDIRGFLQDISSRQKQEEQINIGIW